MPPQQNILDEGPGLRERKRETDAVLDTIVPPAELPKKPAPAKVDKVNKGPYGSRKGEKRYSDKELSDMTKPLGSYKKGTDYVPKTGVYQLHEGEAVTPAKENPMKGVYDKITEGGKKPKKELKEVRTRKAKSGGYIHEHHHTEPAHHPMEEHTTPDTAAMLAHMQEHMGSEAEPAGGASSDTGAAAQDQALGM